MQFLIILVAILLGTCALMFVLYPIYERMRQDGSGQKNREMQSDGIQGDSKDRESGGFLRPYHTGNTDNNRNMEGVAIVPIREQLQEEREQTARTALQEVELDFLLGNLAETDYRSLRERYMRRALLAMKSRHDREQELDEAIEEQLRRLRETDEKHLSIERNEL